MSVQVHPTIPHRLYSAATQDKISEAEWFFENIFLMRPYKRN